MGVIQSDGVPFAVYGTDGNLYTEDSSARMQR